MKLSAYISGSTQKLKAAGIGSARLDALILLEDCLGRRREWILAHPESELNAVQLKKLNRQLEKRAAHEPLAYIRGFSEFYGRRFKVNHRVLEPRPESETMITMLKSLHSRVRPWKIADVGTGSGAIGITAALELHSKDVDLYDIDASCLAVAKHNCVMHELHLGVYKRNLLSRPVQPYDVILANLPYVPTGWKINKAAMREPRLAIFGGKDGLDLYRRLFKQLDDMPNKPKFILTESLPPQHQKLAKIAAGHGYSQQAEEDFIQVFKNT